MNPTILSIDTIFQRTSIAILFNKNIDKVTQISHFNHEKNIISMIKYILNKNNIKIQNFNIISFMNGPGNFTGIRIGASIAQGLSIINNTPLIGISTFTVLAEQAWRKYKITKVIVCINANKNTIYWAKYVKKKYFWKIRGKKYFSTIKILYSKILNIKKKWNIIGSNIIKLLSIKNKKLKFIKITQTNIKDLITLTLLKLHQINKLSRIIKLNYLNNIY